MAGQIGADFLTIAEAAESLRVDQSTVRRWIAKGELHAYRVGPRRIRVRREDLGRVMKPAHEGMTAKPRVGMRYVTSDEDLRPLTDEERDDALAALAAGNKLREELLRKRGGELFSPSWELINEARDERTEQLP
jgi:excisionase family DNA binding protein